MVYCNCLDFFSENDLFFKEIFVQHFVTFKVLCNYVILLYYVIFLKNWTNNCLLLTEKVIFSFYFPRFTSTHTSIFINYLLINNSILNYPSLLIKKQFYSSTFEIILTKCDHIRDNILHIRIKKYIGNVKN